jgi:hypothetical protein
MSSQPVEKSPHTLSTYSRADPPGNGGHWNNVDVEAAITIVYIDFNGLCMQIRYDVD